MDIHSLPCALLFAAALAPGAAAAAETRGGLDACALLTSADVEAVQGEPVKEVKASAQPGAAGVLMSQCFFRTPTFARSVSLSLVTADPANSSAPGPREVWRQKFRPQREREEQAGGRVERERESERDGGREREREHESSEPRPIQGVGEEAYWMGTAAAGSLYVLSGDVFLRVSIGGVRAEPERIERSKALARAAAKRVATPLTRP